MNKLILIFILGMMVLPIEGISYSLNPENPQIFAMVMAQENQIFNAREPMDIKFICYSTTYSYCSAAAKCNLTLFYPNQTVLINDETMTNHGNYHNYTIDATDISGIYSASVVCCEGVCKNKDFEIEVTPTGELKPSGTEILIISILFILLLSFMLFTFIWNFEHLVKGDTNIKDVGISLAYYFTLLSFSLLNRLFFMNSEIGSWTASLLAWTSFSHIILPIFAFTWNFFFGLIAKARRQMR